MNEKIPLPRFQCDLIPDLHRQLCEAEDEATFFDEYRGHASNVQASLQKAATLREQIAFLRGEPSA